MAAAPAGPGLYSEIGKNARDLLYKDYHTDQKFTFTTYATNGTGDCLAASYIHKVSPSKSVGGELSHSFSSNENTLTFGSQHSLDSLTSVKARLNNHGLASALIQHEWRPKSFLTVSEAIGQSTKMGLSLALKP